MPKLAKSRNRTAIFITVLTLIFLGASYFFVYVPGNEKAVQARRFLCLQNIDDNIHANIDNSISMLNNLLSAYPKRSSDSSKRNTLTRYISANRNFKNNFTLIPIDADQTRVRKILQGKDSVVTFNSDLNSKEFSIYLSKKVAGEKPADSIYLSIGVRYSLAKFIKPLLTAAVFDNYIVFVSNKISGDKPSREQHEVVYETYPSGLNYIAKDSLLQANSGITSPGIRSLNIGGTDYKVFAQPVRVSMNSEWIIAGLSSNKSYSKEKDQLPLGIVLLLFTTAIGTILLLPWIKLYHMGNKDKLTVSDGVATVLVSMSLMSLLFFVIFKYSILFSPHYKQYSSSADSLAKKITRSFTNELDTAYQRLQIFDSVYDCESIDIKNLGRAQQDYSGNNNAVIAKYSWLRHNDSLLRKAAENLSIDQVYWINENGEEINNWTTNGFYIPRSNLNSRDYFKRIISKKPYTIDKHKFYVEQVVSRSTGSFTSVISDSSVSSNAKVAAMSFTAKSLNNVIMPDGYKFAIIDTAGEVLYNSYPERNLNENLEKEFADSTKLVSSLEARSDTSFDAEYYGKPYYVKIKPFTGLPYFTVVFEDKEYDDARDTGAYVFTLSMLLFLIFFLVVQISVVFFVSAKRSFFKKQIFDTSWIGPKIRSHHQYNIAIIGNLVIIAMLIIFFGSGSFLTYLYILLFSITFINISSNRIFAINYKKNYTDKHRSKMLAVYWLLAFVVLIDAVAFGTLDPDHFILLLNYEILSTTACLVLYDLGPAILVKGRRYKRKHAFPWTYTHSFALMATTRLVVSSGIPVAFFFIYSFNYEQNLDIRYRQLTFARELAHKFPNENITAKLDSVDRGSLCNAGVYYDKIFIKNVEPKASDTLLKYTSEDFYNIQILSAFRLLNNSVGVESNNLNLPAAGTEATFNSLLKEHSDDKRTVHTSYKTSSGKYIALGSAYMDYPHPNLVFWLLLLSSIVVFYYIIHNVIRKLFALKLPLKIGEGMMDVQLLLNNQLNKLVFLLGSPGSGKLSKLLDKITAGNLLAHDGSLLIYDEKSQSKNNVFIADMILILVECGDDDPDWKRCKNTALYGDYSLIIIDHFEYNVKDPRANRIKLDFLESLMQKGHRKVIIVSTVHPLTFLDSFEQHNTIPESELERWQVLLGHFRIVIESLEVENPPGKDAVTPLEENIIRETKYSHYLYDMQKMMLGIAKTGGTGSNSDSLIFKLQITSHYFYTYIWQSLTKEEKFLLYDLAEDGLVNPYDDYNLSMLMCKGLIIKDDGTLMLFNKGFRNFILTAIGNTELNRIKNQVEDNGNWGSLKTPLILALMAILLFLIVSQQEAYTRIITYISALGAGVPIILRVFSLFPGKNQQPQ